MRERIYDLKVGESFTIYGNLNLNGCVFTVESIIDDTAVCISRDAASRLITPLNVSMPFAIQIFSSEKELPVKEICAEAITPQDSDKAEVSEPNRIFSTIYFFMPKENWGKIHADGLEKGMFFHITQVEDEELRKYLATLPMGTRVPKIKISYQKCCNTERNNALCAGAIHLEEPLKESVTKAELPTERDGYLVEMACNGMLTILDCETSYEYRTKLKTLIDPYLRVYLDNHAGFGNLDSQDIKVHCQLRGKNLVRVEWSNREEILLSKELSLDDEVDPSELEKWNGVETEENADADRPVPPYQELPLWKGR